MFYQSIIFGHNHIHSNHYFTEHESHGFVDFSTISGITEAEKALKAGGWNVRNSFIKNLRLYTYTHENGVSTNMEGSVLVYKIIVPDFGTYHITFTATAPSDYNIEHMDLYCGRRNIIDRDVFIASGNSYSIDFFTSVTPYIPAMSSTPCTEKAIYISVCGNHATISKIEINEEKTTTIFVAGDSTLTDQPALFPYSAHNSCGGWAQILSLYFRRFAICNQAHSGLTTNCFRDDGHWNIVLTHLRKGDIVFIQFGHNDQKRRNLSAFGGYLNNLRWYCQMIKSCGCTPVIISPISRIPYMHANEYYSLLEDYSLACMKAAKECHVPFINLHDITFEYLCSIINNASDYYIKGDITHTNDYGAVLFSSFVIDEIKRQKLEPLFSNITLLKPKQLTVSDENYDVPEDTSSASPFIINIPYVDIQNSPQYDYLVKAFRFGLLDPCIMHLHPSDTMPRAQFLMIFFKAIKKTGTRPYLGFYCDISFSEWDSSFVQTCINEKYIDFNTTPNHYFRPNDALTFGEFSSFLIRSSIPELSARDVHFSDCFQKAKEYHIIPPTASENDFITRADCYKGLVIFMEKFHLVDKTLPSDIEMHPVH